MYIYIYICIYSNYILYQSNSLDIFGSLRIIGFASQFMNEYPSARRLCRYHPGGEPYSADYGCLKAS